MPRQPKKLPHRASRLHWAIILFGLAGLGEGIMIKKILLNLQSPPSLPVSEVISEVEKKANLPAKLVIPRLNLEAEIEPVETNSDQAMATPENPFAVGWFKPGGQLGENGSLVIGGHLDSQTGPAVFYSLGQLKKKDYVYIFDQNSRWYRYEVIAKEIYEENKFPVENVFNLRDKQRLNLITCLGTFNRSTKRYSHRLVVYTEFTGQKNDMAPYENKP